MKLIKHKNVTLKERKFVPAALGLGLFFLISMYLYSQDTPQWYETWWTYMLYGAGIAGFLFAFFFIRRRTGKLTHEKQKLEQLLRERTKESNEKNLKLKEQSEKLTEIDHMKSLFFANISHEFRTTLTLMMSPLEQMLSESNGKKQKQELEMMLRNSQQLLTIKLRHY